MVHFADVCIYLCLFKELHKTWDGILRYRPGILDLCRTVKHRDWDVVFEKVLDGALEIYKQMDAFHGCVFCRYLLYPHWPLHAVSFLLDHVDIKYDAPTNTPFHD